MCRDLRLTEGTVPFTRSELRMEIPTQILSGVSDSKKQIRNASGPRKPVSKKIALVQDHYGELSNHSTAF